MKISGAKCWCGGFCLPKDFGNVYWARGIESTSQFLPIHLLTWVQLVNYNESSIEHVEWKSPSQLRKLHLLTWVQLVNYKDTSLLSRWTWSHQLSFWRFTCWLGFSWWITRMLNYWAGERKANISISALLLSRWTLSHQLSFCGLEATSSTSRHFSLTLTPSERCLAGRALNLPDWVVQAGFKL